MGFEDQSSKTLVYCLTQIVIYERGLSAGDLFKDVVGFCCPDEWFGGLIVDVDVVPDGGDELLEVLEDGTSYSVVSYIAEEALYHFEPRS